MSSIFSKVVFIKQILLRKVGHKGDPLNGVSWVSQHAKGLHFPMKCGMQLLTAKKFSLFHLGRGFRERWYVAHPCLVWENPPWWWYEFKGLDPCGFLVTVSVRTASLPPTISFSTIMSIHPTDHLDSSILTSVVEHVFMPPKLPQKHPGKETERETNVALCDSLIDAAKQFLQILPFSERPLWMQMIKMIQSARRAAKVPLKVVELQRVLSDMAIGGTNG